MVIQIWLKMDMKTRKQSLSGLGAEFNCSVFRDPAFNPQCSKNTN